jgi:hypothetical protein
LPEGAGSIERGNPARRRRMVPIGTLIPSAQKEEQAEHHISSSGGGKRPAVPEEDDAQKPTKAARVAEPASYVMSTIPASNLRVVTSHNAEEKPLHVPLWAVKHTAINTSDYGITGGLDGTNAPPTAPTLTKVEIGGNLQISCPRRGYFFYLFLTHFSRGWAIFREISSLTNLL